MVGRSKKNCRELADTLRAYGAGLLGGAALDYATWFGLWLCVPAELRLPVAEHELTPEGRLRKREAEIMRRW